MEFNVRLEDWPLRRPFSIARETTSSLPLVHLVIRSGGVAGCAEAAGVDYHGERPEDMAKTIERYLAGRARPPSRADVMKDLPAGGARNAIDCALWDLEAKAAGTTVADMLGFTDAAPVSTLYTLSLNSPEQMAAAIPLAPAGAVLKLKLGGGDGQDLARVAAVRAAAPGARLVVDVNEGWRLQDLQEAMPPLAALGVELIEQPLPAGLESHLIGLERLVPICADESANTIDDLDSLGPFDAINVKLDKSGGLTAALALAQAALARGKTVMVGSMIGTSLGMAPAFQLAHLCAFADLDGPLLLAADRDHAMRYEGSLVYPPSPSLWG